MHLFVGENIPKPLNTICSSKKDRIMKTYNKSGTKTKLKPYYDRLQVLNIDGIYKLEGAKFMPKGKLRKLFVFFGNQLGIFRSLFSIHTYST